MQKWKKNRSELLPMEVTSLSTFHMIEAIIQRSVKESATVNSWLVQKQRWQWHSTLALDGAFPCLITKQYIATVLTVLLFGIMNPLSKNQQQSLPTVGHHKGFCDLKWTRPPFVHQVPTAATFGHTWPACQQHICTWGMPATYLSKISVKTYWKFFGRTSAMSKSCKIT